MQKTGHEYNLTQKAKSQNISKGTSISIFNMKFSIDLQVLQDTSEQFAAVHLIYTVEQRDPFYISQNGLNFSTSTCVTSDNRPTV